MGICSSIGREKPFVLNNGECLGRKAEPWKPRKRRCRPPEGNRHRARCLLLVQTNYLLRLLTKQAITATTSTTAPSEMTHPSGSPVATIPAAPAEDREGKPS